MDIQITFTPSPQDLALKFNSINLAGFLQTQIDELSFLVEKNAQSEAPVKTGALRTSILAKPKSRPLGAEVNTGVNYAIFVHEGTRKMKGTPFMEIGTDQALKSFDTRLATALEDIIDKQI